MPQSLSLANRKYRLLQLFPEPNLICAFSVRQLKNMSLCYGDKKYSLDNRKNFLAELGIDYRDLVCAEQVHRSQVRYAKDQDRGKGGVSCDSSIRETDALITDKKNLPLAVFTADCLSIFLYEPRVPLLGLIHAGWQGSRENITVKTVELMKEHFNIHSEDLHVGFGPGIRECCYEVGKEFTDFFPYGWVKKNKRYYLDLVGINRKQVLDLGVRDTNIVDSKICTSCQNKDFFSYRKEGDACGRIMSVMMLK